MTPDGQIANPLDKAANREPFLKGIVAASIGVVCTRFKNKGLW